MKRASREWWERRAPRTRAALRWGLPLLAAALAVLADWLYRRAQGVASRAEGQTLLFRVGVVFAVCAVVKVGFTRRWTVQDLGMAITKIGTAGLCVRALGRRGPQPMAEWERDLIQSLLEVGGLILLIGLVLWAIASRRQPADAENATGYDGYDRRKNRHDRRRYPPPPRPSGPR